MTTLTSGATTLTPELVDGYEATQASGNLIHEIVGRADPDVTLRPARSRAGTLRMLFLTAAAAETARAALAAGSSVWALNDDLDAIEMSFVLDGDLSAALDNSTRSRWIVAAGYREVLP